jgi:TRAP-type uncharacterized transport system substrate-binding protein
MKKFTACLLVLFSILLVAQERILVASSSVSGTYELMTQEISDYCSTESFVIEAAPGVKGGVVQNLDALKSNKAMAAFVRTDVVYAAAQSDPSYRNFKTLVALYPEDIHVLILRDSQTKKLGRFSFGNQTFDTAADLAGFAVGAASGGHITARILTAELHFGEIKEFGSGKEVMAALDNGTIAAAIFVGGTPLPSLTSLSGDKYKLLAIPESVAVKLSGVYKRSTISYENLHSGAIATLSSDALILTRKYTLPKMIQPQATFRACFYAHLDELKETPGKHPKWQEVSATNHGNWEWYELPDVSRTIPVTRKRAAGK